ncbi:hypothetical protein [Streptomyces sp. N35]|uniref:hypothetical protein n=1 Tax=Streptomyces sp. N35 TaxID=2795730 RepID=UPI0018F5EBD6|nr:hypothetical protein [Streptomyces sp. N35]
MTHTIKKMGVLGAAVILAAVSAPAAVASAPKSEVAPLAACRPFVDKETAAGALHLQRCVDAAQRVRYYGWMQKFTDDDRCVIFRFESASYSRTWSVCEELEYTNVDTSYRPSVHRFMYAPPK